MHTFAVIDKSDLVWLKAQQPEVQGILAWLPGHKWTIETFWADLNRIEACWVQCLDHMDNMDLNRLMNMPSFAIAPLAAAHQQQLENEFNGAGLTAHQVSGVSHALDFITHLVRENPETADFTWNLPWRVAIARLDKPETFFAHMSGALLDARYTDAEKQAIVVECLSAQPKDIHKLHNQVQNREQREPIVLWALLDYARTDNAMEKMKLWDYISAPVRFSTSYTAADLAQMVMPGATELIPTLVSLDIPFDQAWALYAQQLATTASVVLPEKLSPT